MEAAVRARLGKTAVIGQHLHCFDVLDSTNTHLKQLARDGGADGTVVIAGYQTAGRGRMERVFQSPEGKGLYLSVLLRPELPPEKLLPVTALAGVAVCAAVERLCGVRPGLKWPNDPVLNRRKIGGILTELVMLPGGKACVVLGIGLNVFQTAADFTPEVAEIASSLTQELGTAVSREELAAALLEELDQAYAALKQGNLTVYLTAYRRDCVNLGKTVQLLSPDGGRETVSAVDIDEAFGLVVHTAEGGEKVIRSGEASVRGLYGYVE